MTRRYIRMTREDYEKKMRDTELYFLGEAPENECCPTCGEHDFFFWLGHKGYQQRMTGRDLIDAWNEGTVSEYLSCSACDTHVAVEDDKIVWDEDYVYYTPEQFKEALDLFFDGNIMKLATCRMEEQLAFYAWLKEHYPEQSEPIEE